MQNRAQLAGAIADVLRGNLANPFHDERDQGDDDLLQAAEQVLDRLAAQSADDFPIHADSHGVRFYLAPGRQQHRVFALVWDGRMWRTGAEWSVPPALLQRELESSSNR